MIIIIPARLGSNRLPGKPLRKIAGIPLIQHTYFNAVQAHCADRVIVATDDSDIAELCNSFGAEVFIATDKQIANGTERCAMIARKLEIPNCTPMMNVQGDKWNVNPVAIDELANNLLGCHGSAKHNSLFCLREHLMESERSNDGVVKVVTDADNHALIFSRTYIPMSMKHCGIYGYYASFLHFYTLMQHRTLERAEHLEQMRVIENGSKVICKPLTTTSTAGDSINTLSDLEQANKEE